MEISLENRLKLRESPKKPIFMHQNWRDLLFIHWKIDADLIQQTLPEGLFVDTFNGEAYIGIIPFLMQDLHLPYMPPIPGLSNFYEVNVRTYVYDKNGIPGVWFYSLHINSKLSAFIAKKIFGLPYHFAEMTFKKNDGLNFEGHLNKNTYSWIEFNYTPINNLYFAQANTLEFFLVERYILFSLCANQLYKGRVYHTPYPLSKVIVKEKTKELFKFNSFTPPSQLPDNMIYSPGVKVDFFKFEKVN